MDSEQIHKKIGRNLQAIRKSRNLSLDQASEITGVSKAMIGQIERGESNPTITIIWKIVNGLHISFTSLIQEDEPQVRVVRLKDLSPFEEDNGLYRTFPVFPFDQQKKFEIYYVEMDPGCVQHSEAHNEGVEEYIMLTEGELSVSVRQENHLLKPGDAIHFIADQPHSYENVSGGKTAYQVVIYYPS
ncbi:Cupin domain protein [Paenibacillus sp. UNCCL117]|uniref:helix-turn-helix domain-containing protein n=1 Tax=unclassified Paenibacillus TaxID=185978 RepID=UPI00088D1E3B|nr:MULTISPECIES: XRE family transcriptional regulator [unclassified Paenibacillus]SDD33601.1 Cupin domain protein [Paenibacillus sp. cl123]SFW39526.1 Cupin domain protein [Paenibacillus sp. UNCCL117]